MSAVRARVGSELRRNWKATTALAVLVGLVGGVAIFGVAGYRRTSSALDRFLAYSRPFDVFVYGEGLDLAAVEHLPQVADADQNTYFLMAPSTPAGRPDPSLGINPLASARGSSATSSERPIVVEGRLPRPDAELDVAINEAVADARRLGPGDTLRMWAYTADQFSALLEGPAALGTLLPDGPALDLTVTALVRYPYDVSPGPGDDEVVYLSTQSVYLTPAFHQRYLDEVANFNQLVGGFLSVRLANGPADLTAFAAAVRDVPGGASAELDTDSESRRAAAQAQRAVDLQALGLLAFAALGALAGLAVVGQSLSRQVQLEGAEHPTLRALGMTPGQLAAVAGARVVLIGGAGAVIAVAVAIALSPLAPIGVAADAEVDPGLAIDLPVLGLGAVAVVVAAVGGAALPLWRVARLPAGTGPVARPPGRRRTSMAAEHLARAGAPASAVTGVRAALETGRGPGAVPVRTALAGTSVAVAALAGALTLAASLDHLVATPRLQGWDWDVMVGDGNVDNLEKGQELLPASPVVEGFTAVSGPVALSMGGADVTANGFHRLQGDVGPEVLEGRLPKEADEVALGPATLGQLDLEVGDRVEVGVMGVDAPSSLTVVGSAYLGHGALTFDSALGEGAALTLDGIEALVGEAQVAVFLVDYAEGVGSDEAFAALQADWGQTVLRAMAPEPVHNLARVAGLPLAFAALVAVLAVATLGHTLATSVRHRRRDLAVLKSLGFARRQVGATVAWQANVVVIVALAVGLPLGVAGGRWAWTLVAESIGSPAPAATPVLAVLAIIPLALVIATVLATLPAHRAARIRPAVALRAE